MEIRIHLRKGEIIESDKSYKGRTALSFQVEVSLLSLLRMKRESRLVSGRIEIVVTPLFRSQGVKRVEMFGNYPGQY